MKEVHNPLYELHVKVSTITVCLFVLFCTVLPSLFKMLLIPHLYVINTSLISQIPHIFAPFPHSSQLLEVFLSYHQPFILRAKNCHSVKNKTDYFALIWRHLHSSMRPLHSIQKPLDSQDTVHLWVVKSHDFALLSSTPRKKDTDGISCVSYQI